MTDFWPFWIGGLAIASVSIALVITTGKFISVTRGYASACSIVSRLGFFQRPELGGPFGFRTFFILGITLGGALAALTTTGWHPTFALGKFDEIWGNTLWVKGVILMTGGFLWGYGSRMAKGCTSGNSIAGISKGSLASLVATACFLVAGVIVTWLIVQISGVH